MAWAGVRIARSCISPILSVTAFTPTTILKMQEPLRTAGHLCRLLLMLEYQTVLPSIARVSYGAHSGVDGRWCATNPTAKWIASAICQCPIPPVALLAAKILTNFTLLLPLWV